jgi:hypothetical protein
MKKIALFAFNGELMCFVHVLLNALDMKEQGFEVKIVIEGSATKLIPDFGVEGNLLNGPYNKVRAEMGTAEDAKTMGLALLGDMWGHPSMAKYLKEGYEVITF